MSSFTGWNTPPSQYTEPNSEVNTQLYYSDYSGMSQMFVSMTQITVTLHQGRLKGDIKYDMTFTDSI